MTFRTLLFQFIIIFSSCCFANEEEDFIDLTIQNLLQEEIIDKRISIEQRYNSKTKIAEIKLLKDKIKSIKLESFNPSYSSFVARIEYDDNKFDIISGKYISYIKIPIAGRYIKFGEIVQLSDLIYKKIRLDQVKKEYATDNLEVVGMQAKKYIAVGKIFTINDIAKPIVLKNTDPVNIIYSSGVINLKTVGISLGAGAIGDMVKVKNTSSGAVLLGEIVNNNTVQVGIK